MEGAHSRVEAYIASSTSPPYVSKQLTALFHTQPLFTISVCSNVATTNDKLRILSAWISGFSTSKIQGDVLMGWFSMSPSPRLHHHDIMTIVKLFFMYIHTLPYNTCICRVM